MKKYLFILFIGLMFSACTPSENNNNSDSTNHNPQAVDDNVSVVVGKSLVVNVLSNDTDLDSQTLTLVSISSTDLGAATIENNSISFTANQQTGVAHLSYVIQDSMGAQAEAILTINVIDVINNLPVVVNDANYSINSSTTTMPLTLSAGSDIDGDTLSYVQVSAPSLGSISFNSSNNKITYTPDLLAIGEDSFSFRLNDGHGDSLRTATMTIVLNPDDGTAPKIQDPMSFSLTGDPSLVGQQAISANGIKNEENCFTSDSGQTFYTTEQSYSGGVALKTTVTEGSTGFGSLGGIVNFKRLEGGRMLKKGDTVWIRVRLYVPSDYQFNIGRSKFIRFRTGHPNENGGMDSAGYDDLYLDGSTPVDDSNFKPYWFIFEGAQIWYKMGTRENWLVRDSWITIELQLTFDDKTEIEGGDSLVRLWIDGTLIGETRERRTLKSADDVVYALYFFTYYGNETSPKTQSLYFDDLDFTTEQPTNVDSNGHHYIGM